MIVAAVSDRRWICDSARHCLWRRTNASSTERRNRADKRDGKHETEGKTSTAEKRAARRTQKFDCTAGNGRTRVNNQNDILSISKTREKEKWLIERTEQHQQLLSHVLLIEHET